MIPISKKVFLIKSKLGSFQVKIWYDKEDKAYLVEVPSLPGVVTFGVSFSDAKKMAKDAIELYCECEVEEGNFIIDDLRSVVGKLPASRVVRIAPVTR